MVLGRLRQHTKLRRLLKYLILWRKTLKMVMNISVVTVGVHIKETDEPEVCVNNGSMLSARNIHAYPNQRIIIFVSDVSSFYYAIM